MLEFLVFNDQGPADHWDLRNAYLIGGADGNPIRGTITFRNGRICCEKRDTGPAALCLLHPAGELGEVTLQTCILPERNEPYLLTLELARHRLMLLLAKLEDWSLLDLEPGHVVTRRTNTAKAKFIEALAIQHEDPAAAEDLAHDALLAALDGTEELALTHAELLLNRRRETNALPARPIGCGIALNHTHPAVRNAIAHRFDYLNLPMPWRALVPEEGEYKWNVIDGWADWAKEQGIHVIGGPLICFEAGLLPDWLYIWEHDYDTIRDLVYEHLERILERYGGTFQVWNVVAGLHVNQHFQFTFDQLMDLTRMATMLVKKIVPAGRTLIEIRQPYGEYFAQHVRSIPPRTYVDLIQQQSLQFDAYSLRIQIGQAMRGQFTRDLMQISALIDEFGGLGKPLYITYAAPSEPVTSVMLQADPTATEPVDDNAGYWRRPWSEQVQAHWLEAVYQLALSKPFVEGVAWADLVDHENIDLPLSGLITEAFQAKPALRRMAAYRQGLLEPPVPKPAKTQADTPVNPTSSQTTGHAPADPDAEA